MFLYFVTNSIMSFLLISPWMLRLQGISSCFLPSHGPSFRGYFTGMGCIRKNNSPDPPDSVKVGQVVWMTHLLDKKPGDKYIFAMHDSPVMSSLTWYFVLWLPKFVWVLYVWSHLDLTLGLDHLEFGLSQLLFQLPDLSFEGLFFLVIPLHCLFRDILNLAGFDGPLAVCCRIQSCGGGFTWIDDVSTVRANFHFILQRWRVEIKSNYDIQELKNLKRVQQ